MVTLKQPYNTPHESPAFSPWLLLFDRSKLNHIGSKLNIGNGLSRNRNGAGYSREREREAERKRDRYNVRERGGRKKQRKTYA